MIAVKKIKPQQLFTVKSKGFLQLHPRAKTALPIKYKNKFLFSGTRARPNSTSSHSKERKNKTTKYPNKIYLLNKQHKPLQFLQALCSQHHSCPASPPHTVGLQGKRTSRQQQYMCEKVTRQTRRGHGTCRQTLAALTYQGGETALLQLKPGASPEPAALSQGHLLEKHCMGQGPLFGAASTLSEQRSRAELTPSGSWKGFQGINPQPHLLWLYHPAPKHPDHPQGLFGIGKILQVGEASPLPRVLAQ